MKVALVATDTAPKAAFARLEPALKEAGIEISSLVKDADVILAGMSSSLKLAEKELEAVEIAETDGKPFGFYADTYGTIRRPWFERFRKSASFVFVINDNEAIDAKGIFPNAKVVISGNPMWEDFFNPKLSRAEARAKLEVVEDCKVVLCPGGKNFIINILHFGAVIDAMNRAADNLKYRNKNNNFKVVFALHPGDQNKMEAYADLSKYSRVPVFIMTKEHASTSLILPGCDLVVESASTLGIEAACQRIPVIDYFTETALSRLEEATGSREWDLCKAGAAIRVLDTDTLEAGIVLLVENSKIVTLQVRQEMAFPKPPEKGAAIRAMVRTLQELVNV